MNVMAFNDDKVEEIEGDNYDGHTREGLVSFSLNVSCLVEKHQLLLK